MKIFLSASFPSPDSSFDEDRPQSVRTLIFPNFPHFASDFHDFYILPLISHFFSAWPLSRVQRLMIMITTTSSPRCQTFKLVKEIWNLPIVNFPGHKRLIFHLPVLSWLSRPWRGAVPLSHWWEIELWSRSHMRGVQQEVLQPGKVEVSHFIETPALQFLLRSRLCETTRLQHNSECKKYSKQSNVTLLCYAFDPLFSFSSVPLQNTNLSESTTVKFVLSFKNTRLIKCTQFWWWCNCKEFSAELSLQTQSMV